MVKFSIQFFFRLVQILIFIIIGIEGICHSVAINYGISIVGNSLINRTNIGFKICVKECQVTKRCKSVDFYRNTYTCELKSKSLNETTETLNDAYVWHVDIEHAENLFEGGGCTMSCGVGQRCVSKWCVPLECPAPPSIKNAIGSSDKRSFGTTITYECSAGYTARGSPNITCSSRGVWSQSNIVCYKTMDSWILVARFKSLIGIGTYDTWFSTGTTSETDMGVEIGCVSFNYTSTCTKHYRSGLIDEWDTLNITEVKVEMFKLGELVANITFNGVGSNNTSWFSQANYISSGWSDLADPQQTYNYYSIQGHSDVFRSFYINRNYNGCNNDAGWMVSIDSLSPCSWTVAAGKPTFMYSPLSTYCNSASVMVTADVMAVSIKASNFP